jgi:hypothetical protein
MLGGMGYHARACTRIYAPGRPPVAPIPYSNEGPGAFDTPGLTRRLSWATQQLASSWPGAGVQTVPVEPEIIIVRPGGDDSLTHVL